MDERQYYACCATIASKQYYFLWYSDEVDGVLLDGSRIRSFSSFDKLVLHCGKNALPLSENSTANYDLDSIIQWVSNPENSRFDNDSLLNFWNLMDDFYYSLEGELAITDADLDLHTKLSLSSFAVSMPGIIAREGYTPEWTASDRTRLAEILNKTLLRFREKL